MKKLNDLSIREMQNQDLAFAATSTAAEGWVSEDLSTLEGFFLYNPKGCLIAKINRKPVGICVATSFGKSGFIGELIVHPGFRGQGIGARLLNHGLSLLRAWGAESVYLDGVLKAVDLYERNGFHKVTRSWRFAGCLPARLSQYVRRMAPPDLDQVFALDEEYFGADRSFFLRRRAVLFPELCHVMLEGDDILGFIMGRRGAGWISAGPWVVSSVGENPIELLHAFSHAVNGHDFSIAILDVNQASVGLVRSLGFEARPDSPWRMANGLCNDLGTSSGCYAAGSAAKG